MPLEHDFEGIRQEPDPVIPEEREEALEDWDQVPLASFSAFAPASFSAIHTDAAIPLERPPGLAGAELADAVGVEFFKFASGFEQPSTSSPPRIKHDGAVTSDFDPEAEFDFIPDDTHPHDPRAHFDMSPEEARHLKWVVGGQNQLPRRLSEEVERWCHRVTDEQDNLELRVADEQNNLENLELWVVEDEQNHFELQPLAEMPAPVTMCTSAGANDRVASPFAVAQTGAVDEITVEII